MLAADGRVSDVVPDSPADKAKIGPHMKIVAINGRRFSDERLAEAIGATEGGKSKLSLLVENGDYFTTHVLDYTGGAKHPHLVRDAVKPDLIGAIFKARVAAPAQAMNKDLEALQGEWKVVSIEPRLEPDAGYTVTIKGDLWTIRAPGILGGATKTTITIDASKNPKTFDLTTKVGDKGVRSQQGIFKLEGNTLTLCQAMRKAERPSEFKSSDQQTLMVLRRYVK